MARDFTLGMFTYQVNIMNPREDGVSTAKLTCEFSNAIEQACEKAGIDPTRIRVEVIDG